MPAKTDIHIGRLRDLQPIIRPFEKRDYLTTWQDMRSFTDARDEKTPDEIWFVEHSPVYTLGQNAKTEHLLPGAEKFSQIKTDRGGQVTYHGPGQLLVYVLMNLKRQNFGVRTLVCALENSIIDWLAKYHITAEARREAPGVYIAGAKIAALGLRVRRGYSYHGLSLNVNMDLTPFQWINPCGYKNLPVTDLYHCGIITTCQAIIPTLLPYLTHHLGYT